MIGFLLFSAFLLGLLGGAHCASMCSGIVTVLGARHRIIPIQAVDAVTGKPVVASAAAPSRLQPLAYNLGRISSYTVAGAIAGAVGSTAWLGQHMLPVQQYAFIGANLVMIVLGLALVQTRNGYGAYGHAWTETLEGGHWRVADAALARAPDPVRYLPLGVLEDEGPGYAMNVARLLPLWVKRIVVVGAGPAS